MGICHYLTILPEKQYSQHSGLREYRFYLAPDLLHSLDRGVGLSEGRLPQSLGFSHLLPHLSCVTASSQPYPRLHCVELLWSPGEGRVLPSCSSTLVLWKCWAGFVISRPWPWHHGCRCRRHSRAPGDRPVPRGGILHPKGKSQKLQDVLRCSWQH